MPIDDDLNRINKGPTKDSTVTNFAIARKGFDGAEGFESRGPSDLGGEAVDEHTLFGEGSIGKVRYAGLAFMMQQEGIVNLQKNALDHFLSEKMQQFLEMEYPGQGRELQARIVVFFSGESKKASLADLTTHMAGIGDLTRAQQRLFERDGVAKEYKIPDLLLLEDTAGLLDETGKPKAQGPGDTPDSDLSKGQYGAHQYSNLGYALLGLALESSYYQARGEMIDYKELTKRFMLDPSEGRAVETDVRPFKETKFPHQLTETDSVARTPWIDRGELVDCADFSGANAAGGMFCSSSDADRFFGEFFCGFPGTPEYGIEGVNKFFTTATIDLMWQETMFKGRKHCNQGDIDNDVAARKAPRNRQFQGPGFVVEVDSEDRPLRYTKGGGTIGYASMMIFDCEEGVKVDLQARENVTSEVAKKQGREVEDVMREYSETGVFDRKTMMQDAGLIEEGVGVDEPDLEATAPDELEEALSDVARALSSAGVVEGDGVEAASHQRTGGSKGSVSR